MIPNDRPNPPTAPGAAPLQPSDLMLAPEVASMKPWACSGVQLLRGVAAGDARYPRPFCRLGNGHRAPFVWLRPQVDAFKAEQTRIVRWTDVNGNTETGPYWRLRAAAVARGVQFPEREHSDLPTVDEHGRRLHSVSDLPRHTGDMIDVGGQEMPDLNFLNCEPDQLTGDVLFREVDWTDAEGRRLGRKPLVDHMRERQLTYGITPSRDGLSPADMHDEPAPKGWPPKINPPTAEIPCHHYAGFDDGAIHVSAETRRLDVAGKDGAQ